MRQKARERTRRSEVAAAAPGNDSAWLYAVGTREAKSRQTLVGLAATRMKTHLFSSLFYLLQHYFSRAASASCKWWEDCAQLFLSYLFICSGSWSWCLRAWRRACVRFMLFSSSSNNPIPEGLALHSSRWSQVRCHCSEAWEPKSYCLWAAVAWEALLWSFVFCFAIMTIWAMLLVEFVYPLIKDCLLHFSKSFSGQRPGI